MMALIGSSGPFSQHRYQFHDLYLVEWHFPTPPHTLLFESMALKAASVPGFTTGNELKSFFFSLFFPLRHRCGPALLRLRV